MTGHRPERLAEEIREQVARILAEEVKDPRVGFVTVTRVELARDLRHARVFVGLRPGDDAARTMRALAQAAPFVRRQLGQRVRMRFTPEVVFNHDRGLDHADRVAQLLEESRREALAQAPATPAGPTPEEPEE